MPSSTSPFSRSRLAAKRSATRTTGFVLIAVGAYWTQAAALSASAKAFPAALSAIVVGLALVIVFNAVVGTRDAAEATPHAEAPARLLLVRGVVVVLPAVVVFLWDWTGAAMALFGYAALICFVLGERRWFVILPLPAALSLALVYLFRTLLYIRLPDGPWMPG